MDQKISDFQELAGQYAKQYGPHDWKKQAFATDLFDTAKWLDKIRATKNDLEFYDVMSRYVSQLNDAHDAYTNPSNFTVFLGFYVDIYDGKLLVDYVDRIRVGPSQYPIAIGYELVSIDGKDANSILNEFLPYNIAANDRSTRRSAAEMITARYQWITPSLTSIPEVSTVVFRRFDGKLETYNMRWYTSGVPLTSIGRFPGYASAPPRPETKAKRNESSDPMADAADLIARVTNYRVPRDLAVLNFGSVGPIFARSLPGTFSVRLGRLSTDPFYSGTFKAGAYTIGYLRIPNFGPSDQTTALTLFAREIAFFQSNTDGLILDIMRNPGGSGAYANALLSYVMFYPYRTMGLEIRATSGWIRDFSNSYESLKAAGAPPSIYQPYKDVVDALVEANQTSGGLTKPVPWDFGPGLNRDGARDQAGNLLAYTKPVMLLTDEFSASAADGFAAVLQDNGRAPLFGWRTMGAGGNVGSQYAGTYSGGVITLTQSLMSRAWERAEAGGYPVNHYVENVGVHPEFQVDYMTRDNLLQNGKPFVDAFVSAMVDHITRNR